MLAQAITCACGSQMVPLNAASTIGMCPNCDTVQPQEREREKRMPTVADRRFNLAWAERTRRFFG